MTWQPIETAPRGHILVYGKPQNLVVDGSTLTNYHSAFVCSAHWDEIDQSFVLDGGSWLGPFIEPTHWMPLPEPPKCEACAAISHGIPEIKG